MEASLEHIAIMPTEVASQLCFGSSSATSASSSSSFSSSSSYDHQNGTNNNDSPQVPIYCSPSPSSSFSSSSPSSSESVSINNAALSSSIVEGSQPMANSNPITSPTVMPTNSDGMFGILPSIITSASSSSSMNVNIDQHNHNQQHPHSMMMAMPNGSRMHSVDASKMSQNAPENDALFSSDDDDSATHDDIKSSYLSDALSSPLNANAATPTSNTESPPSTNNKPMPIVLRISKSKLNNATAFCSSLVMVKDEPFSPMPEPQNIAPSLLFSNVKDEPLSSPDNAAIVDAKPIMYKNNGYMKHSPDNAEFFKKEEVLSPLVEDAASNNVESPNAYCSNQVKEELLSPDNAQENAQEVKNALLLDVKKEEVLSPDDSQMLKQEEDNNVDDNEDDDNAAHWQNVKKEEQLSPPECEPTMYPKQEPVNAHSFQHPQLQAPRTYLPNSSSLLSQPISGTFMPNAQSSILPSPLDNAPTGAYDMANADVAVAVLDSITYNQTMPPPTMLNNNLNNNAHQQQTMPAAYSRANANRMLNEQVYDVDLGEPEVAAALLDSINAPAGWRMNNAAMHNQNNGQMPPSYARANAVAPASSVSSALSSTASSSVSSALSSTSTSTLLNQQQLNQIPNSGQMSSFPQQPINNGGTMFQPMPQPMLDRYQMQQSSYLLPSNYNQNNNGTFPMSQAMPQSMPQTMSQTMQRIMPQSMSSRASIPVTTMSQNIPQTIPQPMPHPMQRVMPQPMPNQMPNQMPKPKKCKKKKVVSQLAEYKSFYRRNSSSSLNGQANGPMPINTQLSLKLIKRPTSNQPPQKTMLQRSNSAQTLCNQLISAIQTQALSRGNNTVTNATPSTSRALPPNSENAFMSFLKNDVVVLPKVVGPSMPQVSRANTFGTFVSAIKKEEPDSAGSLSIASSTSTSLNASISRNSIAQQQSSEVSPGGSATDAKDILTQAWDNTFFSNSNSQHDSLTHSDVEDLLCGDFEDEDPRVRFVDDVEEECYMSEQEIYRKAKSFVISEAEFKARQLAKQVINLDSDESASENDDDDKDNDVLLVDCLIKQEKTTKNNHHHHKTTTTTTTTNNNTNNIVNSVNVNKAVAGLRNLLTCRKRFQQQLQAQRLNKANSGSTAKLMPSSDAMVEDVINLSSDDSMDDGAGGCYSGLSAFGVNGAGKVRIAPRLPVLKRRRSRTRASVSATRKPKPNKRRDIDKILAYSELSKPTREAKKAEKQKRARLAEKEEAYKDNEEEFEKLCKNDARIVLDFDLESKEVIVEVEPAFAPLLKTHQVDGVKFLFNSTIESVEKLNEMRDEDESGCFGGILAHCMGLGKTFQVIVFLSSILSHPQIKTRISRVLIIVPLNVLKNWQDEFDKWFKRVEIERKFRLFELNSFISPDKRKMKNKEAKSMNEKRAERLKEWYNEGGVLLVTPALLCRMLIEKNTKNGKNNKNAINEDERDVFCECLLSPGPDMVIIDEGHCLKNDSTDLNRVTSRIRTPRRIILTGTPMQNNLSEYYTMVSFVKPNLLGTVKEFNNQFANPITNGQFQNSTPDDVTLMKKRFYVLHKSLEHTTIHRKSYAILEPELPPRHEYVFDLKLTPAQLALYRYYLKHFVFGNAISEDPVKDLFLHFNILGYIWNHPAILLQYFSEVKQKLKAISCKKIKEELLEDLVMLADDLKPKSGSLESVRKIVEKWTPENLPKEEEIFQPEFGAKFEFLFSILDECERCGDKLLVFSQSLLTLDLIEKFLSKKTREFGLTSPDHITYEELRKDCPVTNRWFKNVDYFRIDGGVGSDERGRIIERINGANYPEARLLLISTKAGGVGINLVGANRAIIFDACWNPALDTQAIYRIFRYGQRKPVFIYRFAAHGTMESKIYKRQIQKQSVSLRVVDEFQIERHFEEKDLRELYKLNYKDDGTPEATPEPLVPPAHDRVLCEIFPHLKETIVSYHAHNSLLENLPNEKLTENEEVEAWNEYQQQSEPSAAAQNRNFGTFPNSAGFLPYNSDTWNYYNQFYEPGFNPSTGSTTHAYTGVNQAYGTVQPLQQYQNASARTQYLTPGGTTGGQVSYRSPNNANPVSSFINNFNPYLNSTASGSVQQQQSQYLGTSTSGGSVTQSSVPSYSQYASYFPETVQQASATATNSAAASTITGNYSQSSLLEPNVSGNFFNSDLLGGSNFGSSSALDLTTAPITSFPDAFGGSTTSGDIGGTTAQAQEVFNFDDFNQLLMPNMEKQMIEKRKKLQQQQTQYENAKTELAIWQQVPSTITNTAAEAEANLNTLYLKYLQTKQECELMEQQYKVRRFQQQQQQQSTVLPPLASSGQVLPQMVNSNNMNNNNFGIISNEWQQNVPTASISNTNSNSMPATIPDPDCIFLN